MSQAVKSKISRVLSEMSQAFQEHLIILYHALDPIKDCSTFHLTPAQLLTTSTSIKFTKSPFLRNIANHTLAYHYLFPFLLGLYVLLDSLVIFANNGFIYSDTEMPQLFTHLINPPEFRHTGSITMGLGLLMLPSIYGSLLFAPKLNISWQYFAWIEAKDGKNIGIICNGKKLDPLLARKMYHFRRQGRRLIDLMIFCSYNQICVFFIRNFYLQWCGTARDIWMALVVHSFYFYAGFANLFLMYYFALSSRYIQIRQQFLYQKALCLTQNATKLNSNKAVFQSHSFWLRFQASYSSTLTIFRQISANNRFWSRYLTIYFASYLFEVVYFTYAFFYIQTANQFAPLFNLFFASEFLFTLVLVTYECTLVVGYNGRLYRQYRRLAVAYQKTAICSLHQRMKINLLFSNEAMFANNSFTLSNSMKIDSKMFEMLFSYISLLFLMILKREIPNAEK